MGQVQANEAVSAFFSPIKERAEVLDLQGKLLGYFIPAENEDEILRQRIFADYESGEYQKRKAKSAGEEKFTTEQVLERLRSLGTS
jgi:GTP-sensing pleiotropic transcriptional regulator CodY